MPKKMLPKKPDSKRLVAIFNGDIELATFFSEWSTNGRNATKAYLALHPDVGERSASVLGSRVLAKVDKATIMREFGLTENVYYEQLRNGVEATKWNDFTGEREPDHNTRLKYHDKIGKLLEIEKDTPTSSVAVQINNVVNELKNKYEI